MQLLTPVDLGPVRLPNRVVSTSHQTGLVHDHLPTPDLLAYHAARARGGVGGIFIEATAVDPGGLLTSHTLGGFLPAIVDGYEELAGALHEHGTQLFVQLFHGGREQISSAPRAPTIAPSPGAVAALHGRAARAHAGRDRRAARGLRDRGAPLPRGRRGRDRGLDVARLPHRAVLLARLQHPRGRLRGAAALRPRGPRGRARGRRAGARGRRAALGRRARARGPRRRGVRGDRRRAVRHGARRLRLARPRPLRLLRLVELDRPAAARPARRAGGSARGRPRGGRRAGDRDDAGRRRPRGRGADRRRRRRRGRDDAGADRRPRPGGQGRRGRHGRDHRLHRLQPGLHRPLPRGRADRLRGQPAHGAGADAARGRRRAGGATCS